MTFAEAHQRYLAQVAAFNANPPADDAEFLRVAETTQGRTLKRMLRTPVRSKADALAALDLLEEEVADAGALNGIAERMFKRLRGYVDEGGAA